MSSIMRLLCLEQNLKKKKNTSAGRLLGVRMELLLLLLLCFYGCSESQADKIPTFPSAARQIQGATGVRTHV